jgi:hypothetical protein
MSKILPGQSFPRSPYDIEGGLVYFPRMLDKIRLHAAGKLPEDYVPYLSKGFDGRCSRFLGVKYADLAERVQAGGSDAELLEWCLEHGRRPNQEEVEIWNSFMLKRGWREMDPSVTAVLEEHKISAGLAGRADIETFFDFQEVDEGRKT